MAVPLAQLDAIDVQESTTEAIATGIITGWPQGYLF